MKYIYYIFECVKMVFMYANAVEYGVLKSTGQPASWRDSLVGLGAITVIVISYVVIRLIIQNRFKKRSDEKKRDESRENK